MAYFFVSSENKVHKMNCNMGFVSFRLHTRKFYH